MSMQIAPALNEAPQMDGEIEPFRLVGS